MKEQLSVIESLLDKIGIYGLNGIKLVTLKTLYRVSDVVSSLVPHLIVLLFLLTALVFVNLGLAIWLGTVLGELYWGMLVVAGFYLFTAFVLHFFLRKCIKKRIRDSFIQLMLK